jgi:hypothetical protein
LIEITVFVLKTGKVRSQSMETQEIFCTVFLPPIRHLGFFALSAFWRINNLHALNTPAQFDPDYSRLAGEAKARSFCGTPPVADPSVAPGNRWSLCFLSIVSQNSHERERKARTIQ